MDVIVAILRSLLAGQSPFATVRVNQLYTPAEASLDTRSREYDPKGLDHAEITDTGPVFQNQRPRPGTTTAG